MMETWTFYDFTDGRGVNLVRQWLDSLPPKASAKIDARIIYMCAIPVWPEQYVSSLVGWQHIIELRVVSAGNQYRPLGFYGPGRREFTIVLGATEKGKLPTRVLQAADDNRKRAIADPTRITEHVFKKANLPEPKDE